MTVKEDNLGEENAPSTVKEVGIHLFYMKQDLRDLKNIMATQSETYASITQLNGVGDRVKRLENIIYGAMGLVGAAIVGAVLKAIGILH